MASRKSQKYYVEFFTQITKTLHCINIFFFHLREIFNFTIHLNMTVSPNKKSKSSLISSKKFWLEQRKDTQRVMKRTMTYNFRGPPKFA